jgi:hypothetical protein
MHYQSRLLPAFFMAIRTSVMKKPVRNKRQLHSFQSLAMLCSLINGENIRWDDEQRQDYVGV